MVAFIVGVGTRLQTIWGAVRLRLQVARYQERVVWAKLFEWWSRSWLHICRYILASLSIYAAYLYALNKFPTGKISPDLISLAWVAFALGILLLPDYDITTPWGSVKAKQAAAKIEDSAKKLDALLGELADTTQNWCDAAYTFLEQLRTDEIPSGERVQAYKRFCEDRMQEAMDFIRSENEQLRISLWCALDGKDLTMLVSIGKFSPDAIGHIFKPGEGLLGQAFRERRMWNLTNPKDEPGYLSLPGDPEYRGLLMIPLPRHDRPQYVLVIDRETEAMFDNVKENMAEALGHILVTVLNLGPRLHAKASDPPASPAAPHPAS